MSDAAVALTYETFYIAWPWDQMLEILANEREISYSQIITEIMNDWLPIAEKADLKKFSKRFHDVVHFSRTARVIALSGHINRRLRALRERNNLTRAALNYFALLWYFEHIEKPTWDDVMARS